MCITGTCLTSISHAAQPVLAQMSCRNVLPTGCCVPFESPAYKKVQHDLSISVASAC